MSPFLKRHKILINLVAFAAQNDILVEETGPGVVLRNVQIVPSFVVVPYCARCFCVNTQLGTAASFVNQMLILQVSMTCPSKL